MIQVKENGVSLVNYVIVTEKKGIYDVLIDHERNCTFNLGSEDGRALIILFDEQVENFSEVFIKLPKRRWFKKIDYYVEYILNDKGQSHILYMPIKFHATMKQVATYQKEEFR